MTLDIEYKYLVLAMIIVVFWIHHRCYHSLLHYSRRVEGYFTGSILGWTRDELVTLGFLINLSQCCVVDTRRQSFVTIRTNIIVIRYSKNTMCMGLEETRRAESLRLYSYPK